MGRERASSRLSCDYIANYFMYTEKSVVRQLTKIVVEVSPVTLLRLGADHCNQQIQGYLLVPVL